MNVIKKIGHLSLTCGLIYLKVNQMKRHFFLFVMMIFLILSFSCEHSNLNNPEKQDCDPLVFADTSRTYFRFIGEQIDTLSMVRSLVFVAFDTTVADQEIETLFTEYGLTQKAFQLHGPDVRAEFKTFAMYVPKGKRPEEFFTFYGQETDCGLGNQDIVEYATPVFWAFPELPADSSIVILTNEFMAKIDTTMTTIDEIEKLSQEYNVNVVGFRRFSRSVLLLRATKDSPYNALDMANIYHQFDFVIFAEPNFIQIIEQY